MAKFDPKQRLRNIKGSDYLDVKWRILWLRTDNPDWSIITTIEAITDSLIIVRASVLAADESIVATGMATVREAGKNESSWSGREVEKAETAAIGRALAHAGFGTQFAEQDGDHLADAPIEKGNHRPANPPKTGYEDSTIRVITQKTPKPDEKLFMRIGKSTLWSRQPFRDLGFEEDILDSLASTGETALPHAVTATWQGDGEWRNIISLRRDDTGQVVEIAS